jgi:site-specific recombinase XerD
MFSSVTEVSPMTALRQRMLEDLRIRNYAPTTVACYIRSVAEFAQHFNKPPDQLGPEEIRSWQLFLLNEKRVKLSTYIQAVCALRFFYQKTLHRRIDIDRIPLRYEKKLPVILSKAEVKALLEAPRNLKHRAMLATMYAPDSAYRKWPASRSPISIASGMSSGSAAAKATKTGK